MTTDRQDVLATLMAVEAGAFFTRAGLHTGVPVAIGPGEVREPRIVPAVIVESACSLALAIGAFGLAARRPWGRSGGIGATVIALAGTTLGMAALALGRGQQTELNAAFHRTVLPTLLLGLGLLWSSPVAPDMDITSERRRRRHRWASAHAVSDKSKRDEQRGNRQKSAESLPTQAERNEGSRRCA